MLKGKKAQKKEAEQFQESNLSPNLLTPIETKSFVMKARPKIARTTRNLVYVTAVVFIILSIINLVLQLRLNAGVKKRDDLIEDIRRNSYVEEQVKGISHATKLYKSTKAQNPDIAPHLKELVEILEETVTATNIRFVRKNNYYLVMATSDKATAYATMITKLLENEYIESMTLDLVDYKSQSNEYLAEFKVAIK